MNFDILITNF